MKQNEINDFARKQGYEKAEYIGKWKNYSCYEPIFSDEKSVTGLPLIILVDDEGKIRMSTPEEAIQQIEDL